MKKRDHTKLICDVGELSGLFEDAATLGVFLQKIVEMIAKHMQSDVCSIYLFDDQAQELILKATKGLNPASIDVVRLRLGEGLTGMALQEMRPICEKNASSTPGYRYFPEIGEEAYESFLAVPIFRGQMRVGVVVIQNAQKNSFNEEDIKVFRAITSQLANSIETTKVLMDLNVQRTAGKRIVDVRSLKLVKGKVGSQGLAFAEAIVWGDDSADLEGYVGESDKAYSLEDFHHAISLTERQLEDLQEHIETKLEDGASLIFAAQILMLKDPSFVGAIEKLINEGQNDAVKAVVQTIRHYVDMFERLSYPHLKEKKQDVRDVGRRLLDNLRGFCENKTGHNKKIVIARELFPSEILKLSSQDVAGIILLSGGITSHLSILSRSLQLPLIIADEEALLGIEPRTPILMDAEQGNIYVDPAQDMIDSFHKREEERQKSASLKHFVKESTATKDGTKIQLLANINLLGDLKLACAYKAEGVGLYRTEFPFMIRSSFPSEEEQFVVYRKLVEGMSGKEVTFRTLDIGGDKVLSYYSYDKEENPFLGMRSIRFSLKHKDIFVQQLRAILRAGQDADLRIMFPMISSLDEFLEAKAIVEECIVDLQKEQIPCQSNPKIGMMIELPAVLEIIDALAREADFFSIGTNDFVQYLLAVDRTNEKVAEHYLPEHPSVLRALKKVVKAAQEYKKEVTVCGDMAHEQRYIPYLMGIGIRKFSLDAGYIPAIQSFIESVNLREIEQQTKQLMAQDRIRDVFRMME